MKQRGLFDDSIEQALDALAGLGDEVIANGKWLDSVAKVSLHPSDAHFFEIEAREYVKHCQRVGQNPTMEGLRFWARRTTAGHCPIAGKVCSQPKRGQRFCAQHAAFEADR